MAKRKAKTRTTKSQTVAAENAREWPSELTAPQRAFLAAYEHEPIITRAAVAAGIERRCVPRWRKESPAFAAAFEEADELATQMLEAEAVRRAQAGVKRFKFDKGRPIMHPETGEPYYELDYSDTLLIFMLKSKRPEVYKDRSQHEHTGKEGGPIQTEEKADRLAAFLRNEDAMRKVRKIINTTVELEEDGGRLNGHLNGHAG